MIDSYDTSSMGTDRNRRDEHNDRTVVERVDPLVGSILDNRFRIDFRIAAGGFDAIYRATHVKSGHQVALKVLHTELATSDDRVIARFRREGATLASLRDPHTITAYELGEAKDGPLYIVMELLDGESLFERFRAQGPFAWPRMAAIARMVCSSLGEAHALGIVHRDLKPANIHLENRDGNPDFVKVLDFGIAKIMRDSELDSSELTQAGQMIGTFDYMAPEQMIGGACTAVTDIYTLGVVMYEMIAGIRPFAEATTPTSMLAAVLTAAPPLLSTHVHVPPALDHIVMRCLEREPQNRFHDVAELAAALDHLLIPDEGVTEGVTRRRSATPAPQMLHDELTVIDSARAKRESSPPPEVRAKRESSPPPETRPKRESSPPQAHVIRREGSAPYPIVARRDGTPPPHPVVVDSRGFAPPSGKAGRAPPEPVKRASGPAFDIDQTMPLNRNRDSGTSEPRPADPWASQREIEQRARRYSSIPEPRPSQAAIAERARRESSQPSIQARDRSQGLTPPLPAKPAGFPPDQAQPLINSDPRLSQPAIGRESQPQSDPRLSQPVIGRESQPLSDPRLSHPAIGRAAQPLSDPRLSQPVMHPPYAAAYPAPSAQQHPAYPYARGSEQAPQPQPMIDGRASMPMLDASAWQTPRPPMYPAPARGSSFDVQGYDMSSMRSRDVVVRRVAWSVAILIALVVAVLVGTHL